MSSREQYRIDYANMFAYVDKLSNGARVSWVEFEQDTGVDMNQRGRAIFRKVCETLRRKYISMPSCGVEMSSPSNGLEIVRNSTNKALGAFGRAKETTDQVVGRHLEEMTQDSKNQILKHKSLLATLELSTSLSKKLSA